MRLRQGRAIRVVATVVALFCLPAALGACGGSSASSASEPVELYLQAIASGDGAKACEQFSGPYKREFLSSYMEGFSELGASTCEDLVDKLSALLGTDEVATLREAQVNADVNGDRASVTISGGGNTAAVQRVDGRWLIVGGLNFEGPA